MIKKIAYIINSLNNSGGIERVLCTKANYFADVLGYEVHIIVLKIQGEPFFAFSEKIHLHSLEINKLSHKPWMIFGSRSKKEYQTKLFQKLEEIKPDITISVFGLDAEFLYKAKDGSQKVLEFHFTKNYLMHLWASMKKDKYKWLRWFWLQFLQKKQEYYAGKYDHVVLLTERDKQLWGGGNQFEVIPNPLSFQTDQRALLKNKVILSMGRLVIPKGFDYLIKAFSLLEKTFPEWTLQIYGDGQDKEYFLRLINELSLQDKVSILPPNQQVETVMMEASIFVLPSLYDGFGLVLTEAMECGVPCVAFDCECGPSEIIMDQEDGFLVPLGNIQDLAKKMECLMSDMSLSLLMGMKAKENMKRFEIPAIMNLWLKYLNRITKENYK